MNATLHRYLHFDFHKECSRMRWERLSLLMNQLDQDQISFGYVFLTIQCVKSLP